METSMRGATGYARMERMEREDDTIEQRQGSGKRISPEKTNRFHILQMLVALGSALTSLGPGMSMGFSAVALPQLRSSPPKTDGTLHLIHPIADNGSLKINATEVQFNLTVPKAVGNLTLTDDELGWFMSVAMATTPLGCFIAGYLNDLIGRKGALISVAVPGIIGWLLLAMVPLDLSPGDPRSPVIWQMILGRALNGFAIGMSSSPGSILICETTAPRFRGALICIGSLVVSIGILMVYFLGDVASGWRMIAAFGGILTGVVALLSTLLPESPVWLRSKGRHGDADWVCYRLGLRTSGATLALREGESGGTGSGDDGMPNRLGVMKSISLLLEPKTLRLLFLLAGLFLFQQASGIYVVMFNAVEIAAASGIRGAILNGQMTAVLLGTSLFIGLSFVCIFVDRLGRRPTIVFSAMVAAICMGVLGIYVQAVSPKPQLPHPSKHTFWTLLSNGSEPSLPVADDPPSEHWPPPFSNGTDFSEDLSAAESPWHSWIPLAALLTWAFSMGVGLHPLPWTVCPELLPAKIRGVGYGILSALAYTFAFITLRVFTSVVVPLGLASCMLIMSASSVGAAVYTAVFLPETKGMSVDGLKERKGKWNEIHTSVSDPPCSTENYVVYG